MRRVYYAAWETRVQGTRHGVIAQTLSVDTWCSYVNGARSTREPEHISGTGQHPPKAIRVVGKVIWRQIPAGKLCDELALFLKRKDRRYE